MSETVTEWGVRWTIPSGSHMDNLTDYYGDEAEAKARHTVAHSARAAGQTITLVRRTVTYEDWEEVPQAAGQS